MNTWSERSMRLGLHVVKEFTLEEDAEGKECRR